MAETATSPAPAAENKQAHVRPTKPDEEVFKKELAKAEKEHKASMDRLVRPQSLSCSVRYGSAIDTGPTSMASGEAGL